MRSPFPTLYAVVDAAVCRQRGLDVVAVGRAFLEGGARLLQLRAKDVEGATALAWCDALVEAGRARMASILINDRSDWCAMSGAAGVHVGQEDVPVEACRRVLGPSAIIGLSTHTRDEIAAALDQPISYLAVGPVFGTTTKSTGYDAVGLDLVAHAAARAGSVPVVAIGGITLATARAVIDSGASSVVVITDLLTGGDPKRRAEEYLGVLGGEAGRTRRASDTR